MWREPLLGQASLEEWHAAGEVGETVHPVGDLATNQDLAQGASKVVAVPKRKIRIFLTRKCGKIRNMNKDKGRMR